MALSNDLVRQFAKITNDNKTTSGESTVYGTTVLYDGSIYVKIDGSDSLTPVESSASMKPDERVMVLIKNHTATVTGNLSDPSASSGQVDGFQGEVDKVASQVSEFEIIMAHRVTVDELNAVTATISNLKAITAKFNNMEVVNAEIDKLLARYAELEYVKADDLEVIDAIIENLEAEFGSFDNLTTEDLDAINAEITNLKTYNADFTYVSAEVLSAVKADIKRLYAEKISVTDIDAKYANIDFANITEAAIEKLFADSGIIRDIIVSEGKITGELVGVTIKGDLIEANTLKAEQLVVRGSDGKYYKLNTDFAGMPGVEPVEEDMIHGSSIVANSITAERIAVDDLVAFDATIGGFTITKDSLYSGVKSSADNTTRGVYLDNTGQVAFGDSSNFLRYYKDQNGNYKLEIRASSLIFGNSGKNVESVMSDAILKVDVEYASSDSENTVPTSGWNTKAPTWESGKYMWQRTVTTYGNDRVVYSDPICISGAVGPSGKGVVKTEVYYYRSTSNEELINGEWLTSPSEWFDGCYYWQKLVTTFTDGSKDESDPVCITGERGSDGSSGKGIASINTEFYKSTSKTTQTGGTGWQTDMPTWEVGYYLWTRSVIVYTNPTETVYTTPICDSSWEAVNEIEIGSKNLIRNSTTMIFSSYWFYEPVASDGESEEDDDEFEESTNTELNILSENNVDSPSGGSGVCACFTIGDTTLPFTLKNLMTVGQEYTLSLWIKSDIESNILVCENTMPTSTTWNKYVYTFEADKTDLEIYFDTPGVYYIYHPQLERGNIVTDWSESPFDINDKLGIAQDTADDAIIRLDEVALKIDEIENTISSIVFGLNEGSMMTQTEEGWVFSMGKNKEELIHLSELLDELKNTHDGTTLIVDELREKVNSNTDISSYVRIDDTGEQPFILLGTSVNDKLGEFALRITNTSIQFVRNNDFENPIAWISNQELHIRKAVLEDELAVGGFVLKEHGTRGNVGWIWKGVNN